MKNVFKTLTIAASLFISAQAFAYESSIICGSMVAAHNHAQAAQNLTEKNSQAFNRIDGLIVTIKNALIFKHCTLENIDLTPGSALVSIKSDAIFKCPQDVVLIGLLKQTASYLESSTYGEFGGYRQGAINRTAAILEDLNADLKANPACK